MIIMVMSSGSGFSSFGLPDDLAKSILDHAARIGTTARREGVEKSQLEQLIASLEGYPHERLCLLVTAAFANRQASRGVLRRDTARAVSVAMNDLYSKGAGKDLARTLLGLSKWVYEAVSNVRIERPVGNFEELLPIFTGERG